MQIKKKKQMKKRKMRSQKNKEDSIPSSILGMIFYTSVYNFTDNSAPFQNKKFCYLQLPVQLPELIY